MNWTIILLAALVPLLVGFIWYNNILFGKAWMASAGLNAEKLKGANMPLTLILTLVFGLLIAMIMPTIVIHQMHINSTVLGSEGFGVPGSDLQNMLDGFMEKYGTNFRTFKHGALHGVIAALFFALPVVGIGAIYERRGFKFIAIHTGYWIVTLGIMGGIVCAYL